MIGSMTAQSSIKGDDITPADSAESFPKSHQLLYRDFSDASSVLSDIDGLVQRSSSIADLDSIDETKGTDELDSDNSIENLSQPVEDKLVEFEQDSSLQPLVKDSANLENGGQTLAQLSETDEEDLQTAQQAEREEEPRSSTDATSELSPVKSAEKIEEISPVSHEIKAGISKAEAPESESSIQAENSEAAQEDQQIPSQQNNDSHANNVASMEITPQPNGVNKEAQDKSADEESSVDEGIETEPKKEIVAEKQIEKNEAGETSPNAPNTPNKRDMQKTGSESSLSPASEPFVPNSALTSRSSREQDTFTTPTRSWNVNAASFIPSASSHSGPSQSETTPSDVSNSDHLSWPQHTPVQFGTLPDSLGASPMPSASSHEQQNWKTDKYGMYSPHSTSNGHTYQGQDWNGMWQGQYPVGSTYIDENGYTYILQEDGSWVLYEGDSWQSANEGYGSYSSPQSDGKEQNSRSRHRSDRKTWKERQWNRGSDLALIDILAKHFEHSHELVQSIHELHDGSLRGILDTLGQLEAESRGLLLTDYQEAPELNEENFPSLGSQANVDESNQSISGKGGFANAVRAATPTPPQSPQQNGDSNSPTTEPQIKFWHDEDVSNDDIRLAAQQRISHHADLRDDLFERAVHALCERDAGTAEAWANQAKHHSDQIIEACLEAEQVLYKHRAIPLKRRKTGRPFGPIDLIGLSGKDAIEGLESEVSALTSKKERLRGKYTEQKLCLLLGSQKESKAIRLMPSQVEEWLKASQMRYTKTEPGFIELLL